MEKQRQTAGETAKTNNFDAEIADLNRERDGKLAEIQARIDRLTAQNTNMKQLRQINQAQILELEEEKTKLRSYYYRLKGEIVMQREEYFVNNPSNASLRLKMHKFFAKYPDIWQLWKAYKAEEEGGAQ